MNRALPLLLRREKQALVQAKRRNMQRTKVQEATVLVEQWGGPEGAELLGSASGRLEEARQVLRLDMEIRMRNASVSIARRKRKQTGDLCGAEGASLARRDPISLGPIIAHDSDKENAQPAM